MFSLAIDFFDKFGLERLTEPEKPLNEISSDCNNSLTKNELVLKKGYHRVKETIWKHLETSPQRPGVINLACEGLLSFTTGR